MKVTTRVGAALAAAAVVLACTCGSASAFGARPGHSFGHPFDPRSDHPVFVQTDNTSGNQIVAYDQADNGSLTQAGVYNTGGLGGTLTGSVVDHLASQGSLAYDRENGLLYAVNAGSNTISVFAVFGDHLALRQVLSSGGSFPVSVAVDRGLVYVLNAEEGGSLQGYAVSSGRLVPIPGSKPRARPKSHRNPPVHPHARSGRLLAGRLPADRHDQGKRQRHRRLWCLAVRAPVQSARRQLRARRGPVRGDLRSRGKSGRGRGRHELARELRARQNGTVTQLDSVRTGQEATCWVARAGRHFYVSNAASASLSDIQSSEGGQLLTLLGDTETDPGTVDAAVSADSRFLYVQTGGAGVVDEFAIGAQGALSKSGPITVPGAAGGEGIVAL